MALPMSQLLRDFEYNVNLVSSPLADPASRHAADQWLTQFKTSETAWPVVREVLCSIQDGGVLVYYAASMMAWKAKKQPRQLEVAGPEGELLQLICGLLMREMVRGDVPVARALCSALANVVIHGTQVAKPLEGLGTALDQPALLEFLSILPGECEDAAIAAQSFSMEHAFQLKQRIREWCMDVGAWLHTLYSTHLVEACMRQGLAPPTSPSTLEEAVMAVAGGGGGPSNPLMTLTKSVLACFTAWVKWGCLQYLDLDHSQYLVTVAGALLFSGDQSAVASAVDSVSEVAEHATEAMLPSLLSLAARVTNHVKRLAAHGMDPGNLPHAYAALCTANIPACIVWDAQGAALREGLLCMIQLPAVDRDGEGYEVATPAVNALTDIMEQALLGSESRGRGGGEGPLVGFASSVIDALLIRLQPQDRDLTTGLNEECEIEGLRASADGLVEVCVEALGVDGILERVNAAMQRAQSQGHGNAGMHVGRILDVCLYILQASSAVFTEQYHPSGTPLPSWFNEVMALYRMVPQVAAGPGTGTGTGNGTVAVSPCTLLHWDFLTSFTSLAPGMVPLLKECPQEVQQELMSLLLTQAVGAMSGASAQAHQSLHLLGGGGDGRVVAAAADAVRALFSFAPSSGLQVTTNLLSALGHMLSLLSGHHALPDHQSAARQLVVALVHAVHAVDGNDQQAAAAAQSLVATFVTSPLTAAVRDAGTALAGGVIGAAATLVQLQLALHQIQALLNAFESYVDEYAVQAVPHAVAHAVAGSAIASFMHLWVPLGEVCRSGHAEILFPELTSCMESCIALQPELVTHSLQCVLECIAATFDLPGGCALHRVLCSVVETFGPNVAHQPLILAATASVLTAPGSGTFLTVRGGDGDPDKVLALLTVMICLLRQAARWTTIPDPHPLFTICSHSLELAAANAACNHREISHRSIATLSAFILLVLDVNSPVHGGLLELACQRGPLVMEALLLSLVALHSSANLPKVVSLMSDVARLVTTCSSRGVCAPQAVDPGALCEAAQGVLNAWGLQARAALVSSGVLPAELVDGVLMQWDWIPVLQQAALQVAQKRGWNPAGGSAFENMNEAEMRRRVQRSVRQLADAVKRVQVTTSQ